MFFFFTCKGLFSVFFFFSSRRRHTRCYRDWSSDVCSSDLDSGLTNKPLENVQTVAVPAGGGGVFDVKIDKPGLYPFVSHAFAAVDQGQVGLLNVGGVHGTMTH